MVETEGTRLFLRRITEGDFRKQTEAQTPLGRIGQSETPHIPRPSCFWRPRFFLITGETLSITGGLR